MKIEAQQAKEAFRPVTVTLTLEDEAELAAIYNLFNYTPIANWLNENGISADFVRETLNNVSKICYTPTCNKIFHSLRKTLNPDK